jgi:putative DNA primase/helicase
MRAANVKAAASGQWLGIIQQLAPHASEAVDKKGRHCACPNHGGSDGFRLFRDADQTGGGVCNTCGSFADGFTLLQWLNGWCFKQALNAVADCVGLDANAPVQIRHPKPQRPEPDRNRASKIKQTWGDCLRLDWSSDNSAIRYLTNRGLGEILSDLPNDLRFSPGLRYWQAGDPVVSLGNFPAMVAAIRSPAGELMNIHRTYLVDAGYKASVPSPKKMMQSPTPGATKGGAVQLYPTGDVLCVTEGIETALAIRVATGLPVWAAISAGGLARLQVPEAVKELRIYADNDQSNTGQDSANVLADRIKTQGKRVVIALPAEPGTDWLDLLNQSGVAA